MDDELRKLVDNNTPKLNPLICNGLAVSHFTKVEEYIDQVFRSAARGFPEGLKYNGCKRCSPFEEFSKVTRLGDPRAPKRQYDVAKSDIYLMKYFFSFNGVDIPPRYIYLPFISDAGYITLGGARFNISPLLIDRVISISADDIFIRLLRDRLTFERLVHSFMIDGVQEVTQVIWSSIYHRNTKMRKLIATTGAKSSVLHYLFCKFGFTETFRKFGKCQPVVGLTEINEENYPSSDWVICSSRKIKVKSFGKGYFEPSNVRVAIKKTEFTPMVKGMVGTFFYLVDHFPSRIKPEHLNSKRLWMVLMGHIVFTGSINEGKLHDDIEDHIESLDEYLDSIIANKLKDIDIHVSDIYELLAVIMETFNDRLLEATNKISSMYEKEVSTLHHVLYEITSAIFMLYFKLKAGAKKVLTDKEIISTMNMTLKTGLIYSITRNHGEVSTVSSPGDNKVFKITSILKPQSASNRTGGRKDNAALLDPSSRLHASVAEVGGAFNLPKASPDGRSRINPHLKIDPKGLVLRDPDLVKLLDEVQMTIKR